MYSLPFANLMVVILLLATTLLVAPHPSQAEEQFEEFLSRLRLRGYFDVALDYLDSLQENDLLGEELRSALPYERAVTYLEASRVERDPDKRTSLLNKARQELQAFLSNESNQKQITTARSQLGNILVERARMNLVESEKAHTDEEKKQLNQTAREQFEEAQLTFTKLENDLREKLKTIPVQINRSKQSELHDTRTEYRQQYLQSLLLGATVQYEKVATVGADSPEHKQWLTEAAAKFEEIYQKYRNWLAGRYALLYQARCYQDLGKIKDALAMYNELILQEDDSPNYRKLKTKALQSAIECWTIPEEKKHLEAITQGDAWFQQMRPKERRALEGLEFRLALTRAYLTAADTMTAADPANPQIEQYRSAARRHAQTIARQASPLRKQAREILANFSGSQKTPVSRDNFKNFTEAREAGWEALQQSQNSAKLVTVLQGRLQRVESEEQRTQIQTQKEEAEKAIVAYRQASLLAYLAAVQLADEKASSEDLNATFYYLSFLYYQVADYYDAIVMSQLVMQHYPDSAVARRCAKIALASYATLLQQAPTGNEDHKQFENEGLQRTAEQIVKKWPGETEAQEALGILISLAIQQGKFDLAENSLAQIPEDSPQRGEAELKTGQALWNKYLADAKQLQIRNASQEPPTTAQAQQANNDLNDLKQRAKRSLQNGIQRIKTPPVSPTLANASLSLAEVYLNTNEPYEAISQLEHSEYGSLTIAEKNSTGTISQTYRENTFKTALRAYISAVGNTTDTGQFLKKAEQMMSLLEETVGDNQAGQKRLVAIYVALASDLEQQLKLAPLQTKQALSKGFEKFLLRVVDRSSDLKILKWSAEMFYRLGQENDSGQGLVSESAKNYYQLALETYDKTLLAEEVTNNANLAAYLKMRKASVLRCVDEFGKAMEIFKDLLQRRNAMITVQVEAALTLQQWGDASNQGKYNDAMQGIHHKGSQKKTVWGWATIARKTSDNPKFTATYYQARHHLAYCRYRWALSQADDNQRVKTLKRAKQDITWTAKFHPDLGGETWKNKYDALLKKIQKSLNEKPIGLKAMALRTASNKAG